MKTDRTPFQIRWRLERDKSFKRLIKTMKERYYDKTVNKTLITKAKKIAVRVHGNQVDKNNYPYMAHILDVASRVSHLGESFEIVGLLHDAIEDAESDELMKEILEEIKTCFDEEVIKAITAMSKNPGEDYFQDYLPRLKENKIAVQVKIADSSHNLSKAHLIEGTTLQDKLRNKYIKVLNELGVDGKSCEQPLVYNDGKWTKI